MKANELRIGNYVYLVNDTPDPITEHLIQIETRHLMELEENPYLFDPIPLDEEWLERLGFKQGGVYGRNDAYKSPCEFYFMEKYWIKDYDDYSLKHYNTGQFINNSEIKYVHALQNLYFALTGEELTLQK